MAIQEKDYKDLKEYWDYQRKIQYNKECVHRMAEKFEGRAYNDFGPIHIDDVISSTFGSLTTVVINTLELEYLNTLNPLPSLESL